MRRTNKIISVILALVMILSSMSLSLFASAKVDIAGLAADPQDGIVQGYVTENGNANGINATVLFDWLDKEILPPLTNDVVFGSAGDLINTLDGIGITVNLTSIDNILETIDTVRAANSTAGIIIRSIFNGYSLVTKNWTRNQSRAKTGDYAILKNFLQFLADNEEFLGAFVANKTGDTLNMETLLGDGNDLYNYIKKAVAKLIYNYEKDSSLKSKYDAAVKMSLDDIIFKCALSDGVNSLLKSLDDTIKSKYVNIETPNEVWAFLYNEKGFKFEGSLNGYTYDKSMTLDQTVTAIINTVYQNNKAAIKALFQEYGQRLQDAVVSTEWGAPFADILCLNTTDLSFLDNMSMSGSLKSFNDFAGEFVKGVTKYTNWSTKKNFGYNFEQMFMWAMNKANASTAENNPYKSDSYKDGDFTTYAFTLAKIIVSATVKDAEVVDLLDGCTTTKQVMTKLLPYLVKDADGNSVVGKNSTTYEKVLGDILGYYLDGVAVLYTNTTNKTRYTVGSGKTYLQVLNYAANYYLCDLSFDTILGVDLKKSDDFLTKLDQLQAVLFTGTQTLEYSKASTMIPGVIDAIVDLDIEKLVQIGFEDAFTNINVKVTAANLVYAMINNVLNSTLGKRIFEGNFVSLDNMISNNSLEKACSNLLVGLNNKKNVLLPLVVYLFSALSDQSYLTFTANNEVSVNGNVADANIKVTNAYTKKALKNGTDYTVSIKEITSDSSAFNARATITGKGDFVGSFVHDFTINCAKHDYEWVVTKEATYTEKGSKYSVCKYCYHVGETVAINSLAPAKVSGLKASSATTTSIKLSWSKAAGAATYQVYRSTDGKTWTRISTTKSTSLSVSKLTAGKSYQFKVRAVSSLNKVGSYSSVLKTSTLPSQTAGLKASSVKSTSVKLSWTKVSGATSYEVYRSTDGKNWTKAATAETNSCTVSGLKAGTSYQFKVRAVTSAGKKGTFSSVVKATTLPAKVTGLKATTTATSVKLTWTKAAGASKYEVYRSTDGKKWTKLTTVSTNAYTNSKLTSSKTYQYKVRAVSKSGKYGDYSSVLKATTKSSKVTGLKASSVATTSIKLSWTKVSDASKYEVYRSTDGKKWTKLATTTSNSYTAKSLTAGKSYQFKVRAVLTTGSKGSYSSVLKTGTQTKAVTNVKLSSTKSGKVDVSWSKATGAKKYIVQYTTDKNFQRNIKTTTVTTNKATVSQSTSIFGTTTLYVRVIAVNAYGVNSAATKTASVTVKR